MRSSARALAGATAFLLAASGADAQAGASRGDTAQASRPRVGVVLSGGGAKGLAHVGVLEVLESEGVIPEIVTGASMGAVLGGLYAIGYSPAALDSIVTRLDWASYFRDAPENRFLSLDRRASGERTIVSLPLDRGKITLPSGAISGQRISEVLERLTWPAQTERDFARFPKAFAATATDIETGETIVLDRGSLAEAMRASMSIPSLFAPARMNGRLLIDGGVTRNLPARDARALGADFLICSDVSDPLFPASRLRSLLDVLLQTVTIYTNVSNVAERPLCDIYIKPNTDGLTAGDFARAPEWVRRGTAATAAFRPALRDLAQRLSRIPGPMPRLIRVVDSVRIADVVVEGVTGAAERTVRARLQVRGGQNVSADELDVAVKRVYASELFDHVHYRLEARAMDTALVVTAAVREQDEVGVGLRYDDAYKAALLFTARLRNPLGFGSSTQIDVRLGDPFRIALQHSNARIAGSRLVTVGAASYTRTPVPLYDSGRRVAEARDEVFTASAFAGVPLGDVGVAGVELKGEHAKAAATITPFDTGQRRTFVSGALALRWNSFDRPAFPTRGATLSLRSEYSLGGDRFTQQFGSAVLAVPLTRYLTALGRATIGRSSPASAVPLHERFILGGSYPPALFPETYVASIGLPAQERSGIAVSRLGAALQWAVRRDVFATVRTDVGQAGRTLTLDRDAYDAGVGLALGTITALGPIEISVSGRPRSGRPRLELSLGYPF
jgi:NTE family protein